MNNVPSTISCVEERSDIDYMLIKKFVSSPEDIATLIQDIDKQEFPAQFENYGRRTQHYFHGYDYKKRSVYIDGGVPQTLPSR